MKLKKYSFFASVALGLSLLVSVDRAGAAAAEFTQVQGTVTDFNAKTVNIKAPDGRTIVVSRKVIPQTVDLKPGAKISFYARVQKGR